ncbi:MAG TPA: cupin domain-containing protein [Acidimicrobiales bacterium]|nr:cupin domain-containing protein [Acidimicrobiales bacterium]
MAHYQRRGSIPPKRHTVHRRPDGAIVYEELMGEDGFSSDSSLLYHERPPSAILDARTWALPGQAVSPNHPLLPRHLRLHKLVEGEEWKRLDAVTGRRVLLANPDVAISYVACGETSPLYRNAIGDECVYVESGSASFESVFGGFEVGAGDYVVVPRGTTHRWIPSSDVPLRAYCIEAAGHISPPRRYLSPKGQFLEHAPYCERDLRLPGDPPRGSGGELGVEVYVKHRTLPGAPPIGASAAGAPGAAGAAGAGLGVAGTVHLAANHPFDVVGWDGCNYPYAFNVSDFEPITGRVHQPPPVHQVFEASNFVVCNFVPRKVDYHPRAVPVPYYHSNVDSDEVMFYCGGNYAARAGSGISLGSLSLHPAGFPHGPQPAAYESSPGTEQVDELAVMIDTFRPLGIGEGGLAVEDPSYAWSWAGGARTS